MTTIPPASRSFRLAGWSALVGALAYATLPVVNTIAATGNGVVAANGFIDPGRIDSIAVVLWIVSIGTVAFALGTLLVVLAIHRATPPSVWRDATTVAGVLASAAWVFEAGMNRAMAGRAAVSISETGADLGAQQAAYQSLNTTSIAFIIAGGVLTAVWLVGLATSARRAAVVGWGWAVVALLVAAVLVVGLWALAIPPAHLLLIPFFAGFGIFLLVRARRVA